MPIVGEHRIPPWGTPRRAASAGAATRAAEAKEAEAEELVTMRDEDPTYRKPGRHHLGPVARRHPHVVRTREWREPETQRWHAEQRFEVKRDGEVLASEEHRRSPEGRWYTQPQAIELLTGAGLVDVELFADFSHEPARGDERLFWALGIRPA
jgi:hypothetical protein